MKVLITGVTGTIGRAVLEQALKCPQITSIIAIVRRELPTNFLPVDNSNRDKFKPLILNDFGNWSTEILDQIKDADAMLWTIGTYDGNEDVNMNFPLAFQNAFLTTLTTPSRRFRYIQLSGAFCVQDQSKSLWFMPAPRKIKGLAEVKILDFAKEHADRWQAFIVKPGGVLGGGKWYNGPAAMVMGLDLSIKEEELGAAMAALAVDGERHGEEEGVILNRRIVEMGRAALASPQRVITG